MEISLGCYAHENTKKKREKNHERKNAVNKHHTWSGGSDTAHGVLALIVCVCVCECVHHVLMCLRVVCRLDTLDNRLGVECFAWDGLAIELAAEPDQRVEHRLLDVLDCKLTPRTEAEAVPACQSITRFARKMLRLTIFYQKK